MPVGAEPLGLARETERNRWRATFRESLLFSGPGTARRKTARSVLSQAETARRIARYVREIQSNVRAAQQRQ